MKFRAAIFCLLALTAVTAARAQDVTVDFVKSEDFSKFKTYSWAPGVPARNYLIDRHIRAVIEERLATKGLSRMEQGGDLSLIYIAAVNTDVQVATSNWVNTGNWMTPITSGISVKSQMWEVETGTLVVCLSDASGKNLLWRGTAKSRLNSRSKKLNPVEAMAEDARKTEGKVRRALEKMFKQYPVGQAAR